jgi:hypothetical protein
LTQPPLVAELQTACTVHTIKDDLRSAGNALFSGPIIFIGCGCHTDQGRMHVSAGQNARGFAAPKHNSELKAANHSSRAAKLHVYVHKPQHRTAFFLGCSCSFIGVRAAMLHVSLEQTSYEQSCGALRWVRGCTVGYRAAPAHLCDAGAAAWGIQDGILTPVWLCTASCGIQDIFFSGLPIKH